MRQGLAAQQPGRAFAADCRIGRVLAAVHQRTGHIGQHRRDLLRKGRPQQQHQFATARLAADGDEIVQRLHFGTQPVQSAFEILQRRIGNVIRQARRLEIRQRKRGQPREANRPHAVR
jgi:predicted ester cyclase